MKAALIPPVSWLPQFGHGEFHLLLAHLVLLKKYRAHYQAERSNGAYLVLDNSAHEAGHGDAPGNLRDYAVLMDAQEVVVPDVLFSAEETVQCAVDALEVWFEDSDDSRMGDLNPALMYVPQGEDEMRWVRCTTELIQLHAFMSTKRNFRRDLVLGISKDYDEWEGGLPRLIREYVAPARDLLLKKEIRMHVHMLGWPRNLRTLQMIGVEFPWIRSTDSAKPFVYALEGIRLDVRKKELPMYPGRRKTYFEARPRGDKLRDAEHNVGVFRTFAGAYR